MEFDKVKDVLRKQGKSGGRNPCLSHARGRAAAFTPSPARIPSGPQRNVLPQIGPYRRSSSGVVRNLTGGSSTTVCRWLPTSPSLPNTMAKKQDEGKPHLVAMHPPLPKNFWVWFTHTRPKNIFHLLRPNVDSLTDSLVFDNSKFVL